MAKMEIWIKQDKEALRLPVLPASFQMDSTQNNTSVNVNAVGEVNLLGKRNLSAVSFSSMFPAQKYDFCQYSSFPKPKKCVDMITKWRKSGQPVALTITGLISGYYSIESFSWGMDDGTGDIGYTIEFKKYYKPKVKKVKAKNTVNKDSKQIQPANTERESKEVKSTVYVVKPGDTLAKISKKFTGSSSNYQAIANQNGIKFPSKLQIGQKVVIKI